MYTSLFTESCHASAGVSIAKVSPLFRTSDSFSRRGSVKLFTFSDGSWNETFARENFFVRISISEAVFSLKDCTKINGGLGYEERFLIKWFGRMGIKEKLNELWNTAEKSRVQKDEKS